MHYTSGTTGRPKGVWSGVLTGRDAEALLAEERTQWGFCADDVNLVCSPLYHSAPLRFAAGTLLAGGDVVVLRKFSPDHASAALREHRVTSAFMAPAHLQRLFERDDAARSGRRSTLVDQVSSFRLLAHAGAPCPPSVKERALTTFPEGSVWEFYGSTEGQFTVCSTQDHRRSPQSVGRARQHRTIFTLADDREDTVRTWTVPAASAASRSVPEAAATDGGVLWCRVPSYARFSYWRDAEKTAASWRGDAFSVFDLGRVDQDGYVYLDGRRDDLIITGGVNVYPLEIELALAGLSGVEEVAVFARGDERWGQRVCAAVVRSGTGPGAALREADVVAFAQSVLAPAKRPKDVVFVDAIPRTPTGKVRRSRLAHDLGLVS
jgi:long-chain acyl-CoA synthetase